MHNLLASSAGADRARLLASSSPGSGAWLHALPFLNIGFRLLDQELRVSIGLRLGAKSCQLTSAPAVPRCFLTDIMVCRTDGVRVANQDIMPSMMS